MIRSLPIPLAICALLFLAVGSSWMWRNLGEIPHYGDTRDYLQLARTLEVDSYRGIAYPALLAGLDRLCGDPSLLAPIGPWHTSGPCPVSRNFVCLQLLQALLCAGALCYFVHVFAAPRAGPPGARRAATIGLVALLFFDPLVAHFNLSVMSDGPALAGSLLFCAALADLRAARTSRWLASVLLLLSFLITAGLRPEKRWILLGCAILCVLLWLLLPHRRPGTAERRDRPRGIVLLLVVLSALGFGASTLIHAHYQRELGRWPLRTTVLQQRVVFPNLVSTYEEQPEWVRRTISPAQAEYFDGHHRNGREIVNAVAGDDAELRDRLVAEMAGVAWAEHWPRIVADVLRDTLENLLASASFYVRLGTYAALGEEEFRDVFYSDGTLWTWTRLSMHQPSLSRTYLAFAAALLLLCAALAVRRWRSHRCSAAAEPGAERLIHLAPIAAFVLLNGFAFAATQDLVHIRYTLFAHVAMLTLVYSLAFSGKPQEVGAQSST